MILVYRKKKFINGSLNEREDGNLVVEKRYSADTVVAVRVSSSLPLGKKTVRVQDVKAVWLVEARGAHRGGRGQVPPPEN